MAGIGFVEVTANYGTVAHREVAIDEDGDPPQGAQALELVVAVEGRDRIDLVGEAFEVKAREDLAHVGADETADDADHARQLTPFARLCNDAKSDETRRGSSIARGHRMAVYSIQLNSALTSALAACPTSAFAQGPSGRSMRSRTACLVRSRLSASTAAAFRSSVNVRRKASIRPSTCSGMASPSESSRSILNT